jgi:isopropylmalate/homocitrate/citramalate synthase
MTKTQIEKRLADFGLRLEKRNPAQFVEDADGNWFAHWIIRPDTIGSCMANEVTPLRRLADAEDVIDYREIAKARDYAF